MSLPRTAPVVAALGLAQTIAWASSYYLPAVLATPMARDLGVTPVWVFGGFTLAMSHGAVVVTQLLVFLIKVLIVCSFQILIRWTLPRFRFDQLQGSVAVYDVQFENRLLGVALGAPILGLGEGSREISALRGGAGHRRAEQRKARGIPERVCAQVQTETRRAHGRLLNERSALQIHRLRRDFTGNGVLETGAALAGSGRSLGHR